MRPSNSQMTSQVSRMARRCVKTTHLRRAYIHCATNCCWMAVSLRAPFMFILCLLQIAGMEIKKSTRITNGIIRHISAAGRRGDGRVANEFRQGPRCLRAASVVCTFDRVSLTAVKPCIIGYRRKHATAASRITQRNSQSSRRVDQETA